LKAIKSVIKQKPVLAYYLLTFAISWGAVCTNLFINGIPVTREQFDFELPVAIMAMLLGPSIASIVLTATVDGRAGFRELRARLFKKQIAARWFVGVLLAGPLLLLITQVVFSLVSPGFPPSLLVTNNRVSLLLMGITSGLVTGFFEELGWTGFVMPRLRRRFNILTTGILMGILWGAWHVISNDVMASGLYSAPLSPTFYIITRGLALTFGGLVAFRVLMVWVYDRTGSLFVVMLMHFSYTAFTLILEPSKISGMPLLTLDIISTVVMWTAVGVVALFNGWRLESKTKSQPDRRMVTD
jgi:membrane protease YdiL (CAAX protease family)